MNNRINSNTGLVYPKLSYVIVGRCMKIHNELGNTMLEKHYQRAIERELLRQNIPFEREKRVEIVYEKESVGRYFLDFMVDLKLVLEVKACKQNMSKFHKQVLAYLRQLDLGLGIVVNFRKDRLNPYRVINSKCDKLHLNKLDRN